MTQINDGGPAFPMFKSILANGTTTNTAANGGMSLRDYFAGQALMGFLANTTRPTTIAPDDATWAYCIADAMLAARGATSSQTHEPPQSSRFERMGVGTIWDSITSTQFFSDEHLLVDESVYINISGCTPRHHYKAISYDREKTFYGTAGADGICKLKRKLD